MDGGQPPPSSSPSSPSLLPSPPLPASSPFSPPSPTLPPCTHSGAVEPFGQSVEACACAARASSGTQLAGSRAPLAPSTRTDAPRPNQIHVVVRIALLLLTSSCRRPPQLAA